MFGHIAHGLTQYGTSNQPDNWMNISKQHNNRQNSQNNRQVAGHDNTSVSDLRLKPGQKQSHGLPKDQYPPYHPNHNGAAKQYQVIPRTQERQTRATGNMIVSTPVDNKKNNEYYYQHSPIINSRASDIRDIKSRDSSIEHPNAGQAPHLKPHKV